MIDPATGFFDIVEIGQKTADVIANWLEIHWLTRRISMAYRNNYGQGK
jgi:hypothetical protein